MEKRDAATPPEVELASLRVLYGAKFNAITAALGLAGEAQERHDAGDDDAVGDLLDKIVGVLVDA